MKKQSKIVLALPEYCRNLGEDERVLFQDVLKREIDATLAPDNRSVTCSTTKALDTEDIELDDFYICCQDAIGLAMASALIGKIEIR